MNYLLAIDPGTTQSGFVFMQDRAVTRSGVLDNGMISHLCKEWKFDLAIEMVASYGMPVGKEVFETVRWTGRFQQAFWKPENVKLIYRKDVKMHLCHSMRAKDPHVWQAILDLYGGKDKAVGNKANPGPLYGVKSHARSALAVALTARGAAES